MIRCYNCGGPGHKTPVCPRHGPYYPAPGKSSQDYGEEVQRIADVFAQDIIREHGGDINEDDDYPLRPPGRDSNRLSEREVRARRHTCRTCLAAPGKTCVSSGGNGTKAHKSRLKTAEQLIE